MFSAQINSSMPTQLKKRGGKKPYLKNPNLWSHNIKSNNHHNNLNVEATTTYGVAVTHLQTRFLSKLVWRETLQTYHIFFYWMWILKIQLLNCMFFMSLTPMSSFIQIGCYLLFSQWTYFLCIILDYKNLKF